MSGDEMSLEPFNGLNVAGARTGMLSKLQAGEPLRIINNGVALKYRVADEPVVGDDGEVTVRLEPYHSGQQSYRGTALRVRPNPEDDLIISPRHHSVIVQVGHRELDLSLEEASAMARALRTCIDAILADI
jgi:hypothetical protein